MRKHGPIILLTVAFVVLSLTRYIILAIYTPSGEDMPGQIAAARCYFEGAPCAEYWPPYLPPLYFTMVYGLYTVFGALGAAALIQAFVPSLMVFPTYALLRSLDRPVIFSALGAVIGGASASLGVLAAWNGGYTLFGLVFYTGFVATLWNLYKKEGKPRWRSIVAPGLLFAAAVGSHELIGVLTTFTLLFVSASALLTRKKASTVVVVSCVCIGSALAFAPFYLNYLSVLTNLRPPGAAPTLVGVISSLVTGPWGVDTNIIVLIDATMTVVGLLVLRRSPNLLVVASMAGAYLLVVAVTPANWDRAAVVLVPAMMVLLVTGVEWSGRRNRSVGVAFLFTILIGNQLYSLVLFNNSAQTYSFFCGPRADCTGSDSEYYPVLDYLRTLPRGSVVYSTFMVTWTEAYAGLDAVGPYNLNGRVTAQSYYDAYYSDLVFLGRMNFGNSHFDVATLTNSTVIYLATGGFWKPIGAVNNGNVENADGNKLVMNGTLTFAKTAMCEHSCHMAMHVVVEGGGVVEVSGQGIVYDGEHITGRVVLTDTGPGNGDWGTSQPYTHSSLELLRDLGVTHLVLSSKWDGDLYTWALGQFDAVYSSGDVVVFAVA